MSYEEMPVNTYRLSAEQVEFIQLCLIDQHDVQSSDNEQEVLSAFDVLTNRLFNQMDLFWAGKDELPISLDPVDCNLLIDSLPTTQEKAEEMANRTVLFAHNNGDLDLISMSVPETKLLAGAKLQEALRILHCAQPVKRLLTS